MIHATDAYDIPLVECVSCCDVKDFVNVDNSNLTAFRVIHQNIRSYNKNIDSFLVLLEGLQVRFDCLILTEAWLRDDSDLINIPGYNLYRSYNGLNSSDGVVVYIDSTLSVTCNQLLLGGVSTCLSLSFDWEGAKCDLLAVYRSPNSNFSLFIDGLSIYYSNDVRRSSLCIFAGDINCDLLQSVQNPLRDHYLDTLCDANMISCIENITRPDSSSCLDHIFIKTPNQISAKSVIIESAVTDHFAIGLILHSNRNKNTCKREVKATRNWNKIGYTILNQNWDHVTSTDDVNLSATKFIDTLQTIISENSTQAFQNAKSSKIKPWITVSIVNSIRKRDKLRKQLHNQPFNVTLRNMYVRYRNILQSTMKRAKFNYYKGKVDSAEGDPRKFWSVVNEIAGRPKSYEQFPIKAFNTGSSVAPLEATEISNSFNRYFASVGEQLAEAINPSGPSEVCDLDHVISAAFELRPVTESEIINIVSSMKGRSAPGWDSIPTKLLKDNVQGLLSPILHITNLSLTKGLFPDVYKIAKVIPIHKSGSKTVISNFRPISLLISLAKILEKSVKIQASTFLNNNNIISNDQYGFRCSKNTSDALFDMTKHISDQYSKRKQVLVTFLDLAKAFDSIDRSKLFIKLRAIGFRNKTLNWFKSYFENRKQTVCLNGIESDSLNVDYGVVQGSTLGPLLFLIYINNITKLNLHSRLFLFADDTALVTSGCSWTEAFEHASSDLVKVKGWLDNNVLSINIGKTKCLPIYLRGGPGSSVLKMHLCGDPQSETCICECVQQVTQYKYLGVVLDQKLNWAAHVQFLKQRLRKLTYAFGQLGKVLSLRHCRSVYYAYAQSLLEYGIVAWGGASVNTLRPVTVSQRALIKALLSKKQRFPTTLLFQEFPVLNVKQLFIKNLLTYICKNGLNFTEVQHDYPTRNRLNTNIQFPRLSNSIQLSNSFHLAHWLFRNIPPELIPIEGCSVAGYRRRVCEWLLCIGAEAAEALLISPYV
jgi:hypothetical protein